MKYKMSINKNGRTEYFGDGKYVKASSIPEDILKVISNAPGIEIEDVKENINPDPTPKPEPSSVSVNTKACIFCGQFGKYSRFVNLQTVYLCDEHNYSTTIGKIAQKLKEISVHAGQFTNQSAE